MNRHGLVLSDNNKKVKRIDMSGAGYCWITADTEPVFEGKQCWRLKVYNPRKGWMCWGVAAPKILQHDTFNNPSGYIWAIALNDCWYPTYTENNQKRIRVDDNFKKEEFEMDILLDLDEKMLKFCVVGKLDEENAKRDNEPKMRNYKNVEIN